MKAHLLDLERGQSLCGRDIDDLPSQAMADTFREVTCRACLQKALDQLTADVRTVARKLYGWRSVVVDVREMVNS